MTSVAVGSTVPELSVPGGAPSGHDAPADNQAGRIGGDRTDLAASGIRLLPTLLVLGLVDLAEVDHRLLLGRVFILLVMSSVPGALVLNAAGLRPRDNGLLYMACAIAASLLVIMLVGLVGSALLPHIGIIHPLSRWPMLFGVEIMSIAAAAKVARSEDPLLAAVGYEVPSPRRIAVVVVLGILPLLAVAGAELLNNQRTNSVAVAAVVLSGSVLLIGFVVADRCPRWVLQLALFAAGLSLLWLYSLRSNHLFGVDIQQEYQAFASTLRAGRWAPPPDGNPYRAMLSLTALPVGLANVSGVSGIYLFKFVYPALFAFFPVLVFEVGRRWLPRRGAFVAAAYLVVLPQFASQLSAIARQEVGLLYCGIIFALAVNDGLAIDKRRLGVVLATAGMVLSHYSTSYVTIIAVTFAFFANPALGHLARRKIRGAHSKGAISAASERGLRPVFSVGVVAAMIGMVLLWDVGVTHSTENVSRLASTVAAKGIDVLPQGKSGSIVSRWLNGNIQSRLTADQYYEDAKVSAQATEPWLNAYPASLTRAYPARPATVPTLRAASTIVAAHSSTVVALAEEAMLAATFIGALGFARQRWRARQRAQLEIALVGIGLLGFVAVIRVSGSLAGAYNQERAQLQAGIVLCIGLAATCSWAISRLRWTALAGFALAIGLIFAQSSGLLIYLGGGSPAAALANTGEGYDRMYITDQDVAGAVWLQHHIGRDALIYTDAYGELPIWDSTNITQLPHQWLVPSTIDQGSFVYADAINIVDGQARGDVGSGVALYRFPAAFLNNEKATIYSSPSTRVYR